MGHEAIDGLQAIGFPYADLRSGVGTGEDQAKARFFRERNVGLRSGIGEAGV